MIAPLLLLLLQAAPATSAPKTESWSILAPRDEFCETRTTPDGDIVVCDRGSNGQRLPLFEKEPGATPNGVNPNKTGIGALAAEGTPCAAIQRGCTVGFGPPIVPIIKGAVSALKSALAAKPDKRGRVAIPLD
ncbi:hypothetical protein [uncultured Sphingomonas sp.]|uniref:hypothetical protein n=1 Tax=uncultured Sphingomonas sp. TaxID=158754 RepID=UPI0035C99661